MREDERQEAGLPPVAAEHLDQLLANWREQRQLDTHTAAAIRQAVLAQNESLSVQWWQEQRTQINEVVAQSRRLAYELASAGLALANQQAGAVWRQRYVRLG